jgi:hypothetical protein
MESKDELVFLEKKFIQYPLLFVTNIACDLFKVTKGILVKNVICEWNLVAEINQK